MAADMRQRRVDVEEHVAGTKAFKKSDATCPRGCGAMATPNLGLAVPGIKVASRWQHREEVPTSQGKPLRGLPKLKSRQRI